MEFSVKDIEVQGKQVKLQTWDTGSHDRFSYVRPLYYKGSYGVLVVYDIADEESFENLDKWFEEVYSNCEEIIPAILIGNKADISGERRVTQEQALAYAEKKRATYELEELPYYEVSAKEGTNITEIYFHLTDMMIDKSIEAEK